MNWRTIAENKLRVMGDKITDNPIKIMLVILLLNLAIISNLPKLAIDTSTEGFLYNDDPALVRYEKFKEQFGQDEKIMVIVESKNIFDLTVLKKLKILHNELENNVPHLNDITSLINARNTRGVGDQLIVEDLFERFPQTKKELDAIKKIAVNSHMYINLFFNQKHTYTVIILEPNAYETLSSGNDLEGFANEEYSNQNQEFLKDTSKGEMIKKTKDIVEKFITDDFNVFVAGSLAVNDYNKQSMKKDMQKFVKLVLLMMMIFLFIVFRRISAVILPMLIVVLSLVTTLSIMAFFDTAIKIPTQILPSLLLAIGIGAVVHLLSMFFKHLNEYGDKNKAIAYSLGHSGLAIIMTSLTTAAGMLSFLSAEIAPIADLGIFSAVGIIVALINTLVLLPAILAILPIKQAKETRVKDSKKMDAILIYIADFSVNNAKAIVSISAVIIIIWTSFASQIEFKHDPLSWQPDDSPAKISTKIVDKELRGSVTMEVIIDTKKENGLYNSDLLTKIDTVVKKAQAIENDKYFIGKGWSVAEVLKEIHRALHENQEEYYAITDNDALIPQEFLLFANSGSDDLEDLVDSTFSKARLTFKLPWMEAGEYKELGDELDDLLKNEFNDDIEITITGMVPLFQRTLSAALSSMATSYIIAFILIAIMMIILLRSVKIGLISMIPNLLPIVMSIGFMSMLGLSIDMFTMLVGAIVIGLSVDDTVHFFHNFAKYHQQGLSTSESIKETMLGTGRALIATTIVLSLGFYVYMFAYLSNVVNFGLLAGGAISIALISNIILGPALLTLITKDEK